MIESIIDYYKSKVTSYNLIFKHMRITYLTTRFLICNFLLSLFLLITNMILLINNKEKFTPFLCYFMISLIIMIVSAYYLNKSAKSILRRKYDIHNNKKIWRTREFEELRLKLMVEYLKLNSLYTEKKVSFLRERLQKAQNDKKIPSLIAPGLLLAFIVPIWVEFVKYTFPKSVSSMDSAISSFVGISATVFLIIIFFNIAKVILKETRELFSMNETIVIKYLIEILEDVELYMPEDK